MKNFGHLHELLPESVDFLNQCPCHNAPLIPRARSPLITRATLICLSWCSKQHSKTFASSEVFNLFNSLNRYFLSFPFYRSKTWGSVRSSYFLRATYVTYRNLIQAKGPRLCATTHYYLSYHLLKSEAGVCGILEKIWFFPPLSFQALLCRPPFKCLC